MPCADNDAYDRYCLKQKHIKKVCKSCKSLTKEQMKIMNNSETGENLLVWYLDHLLKDFEENYNSEDKSEIQIAQDEANRLGYKIYHVEIGHVGRFHIKKIGE